MNDIIKAVIIAADTLNANGRIYPRGALEKTVAGEVRKGRTWVTLGMPRGARLELDEIVGQAGNWSWDGDNLQAEIVLMSTPRGEEVKALLEAKNEFDYRPAGIGEVDKDGVVTNFRFISIGMLAKGTGA